MTPPDRPIFFIDWCLGKSVATALAEIGAQVEHHGSHFNQAAPDVEWLLEVGKQGWVVLTKDQAIGSNPLELAAIARAKVKVFVLVSGSLNSQQMATLFVSSWL